MSFPTDRGAHRAVVQWVIGRLACHLGVPAHTIDVATPLAELGVDSVHALSLVGDLEVHWNIEVDATLVFEYPTVSDIAGFVCAAVDPVRLKSAIS